MERVDSTKGVHFCWEASFPDEAGLFLHNFPFLLALCEVLREDIPSHWCFAQKFSIICRQAVFGCLARIIPELCMAHLGSQHYLCGTSVLYICH